MSIKPLPGKLSALIRVAVADLQAVMKDDRYEVDMGMWHSCNAIDDNGKLITLEKCHVCLAGSVIAKSFKLPSHVSFNPIDFENEVASKLNALDFVRSGEIRDALGYMLDNPTRARDVKLPASLESNSLRPPKSLKDLPRWLTGIAAELEAIGL